MSFEHRPNLLITETARRFPIDELDLVTLAVDVESNEGEIVPAGSSGTVVGVWGAGEAYEVEFAQPLQALATVAANLIAEHERTRP
ncbi:hypothetical protein OCOJLMKI_1876 [Methylobacterium iners]|uniref:DUF4926 domain-containing protein n=2 Tax=Methylobacterium iners TaxID=418707 RepID=A0ABQ4RV16_9HYPH|nr:hypothetical protein OCOJLMKI_1876 [Methylobacterium iners]